MDHFGRLQVPLEVVCHALLFQAIAQHAHQSASVQPWTVSAVVINMADPHVPIAVTKHLQLIWALLCLYPLVQVRAELRAVARVNRFDVWPNVGCNLVHGFLSLRVHVTPNRALKRTLSAA